METAQGFRAGSRRNHSVVHRQSSLVATAARSRGTLLKIVIVGSNGRLGAALAREYHKDHDVVAFDRTTLDVENLALIRETLHGLEFDVLTNCAAYTNVDRCEMQRDRAFLINAEAPRVLAE